MMDKPLKQYIAKFWRGNPQTSTGGYETTREVEAKDKREALKKAKEYEDCVYGTMTLMSLELK